MTTPTTIKSGQFTGKAAFVTGVNLPADGGALAKMAVPDISAADLQLD